MEKQDWYDMGSKIGDLVQSAIDSNDFKQLNQSITNTINTTMDAVQKSVKDSANRGAGAASEKSGAAGQSKSWQWQADGKTVSGSTHRETAYEQARKKAGMKPDLDMPSLPKLSGGYKGVVMTSVGFGLAGVFGLLFLIFSILNRFTGIFGVPRWMFLLCLVICAIVGVRGVSVMGKTKQLKQYLNIMGTRDTCTIAELAAGSGRSVKVVKKDLREMIRERMFANGAYLDAGETCLMTSQTAYHQYQTAQKQFELRKAEAAKTEQQKQEQAKAVASLSKESQEILKEGKDFIAHIHECNEAIPDETISGKLDRLETVVTKIFDQVEKEPDSAPDLHKMMSYYLPVTRKLVDAYQHLNDQPIAGQNIAKTKKEIEDSLDTINTAFENLLDRFFQDTAWDISSDISVLHTMMAQDGLMKRDFPAGDNVKKTAEELEQPVVDAAK